jgi:hypothetical protein
MVSQKTRITTWWTVLLEVVQFAFLLWVAIAAVGLPFSNAGVLNSGPFWFVVLSTGVFGICIVFYDMAMQLASQELLLIDTILWIVGMLLHLAILIAFAVYAAACEGDVQCDNGLAYDGTRTSAYTAPTLRYIMLIVGVGAMMLVDVVSWITTIATRKQLLDFKNGLSGKDDS